jgi:elongation factor Tu
LVAEVRFLTAAEGGRTSPIIAGYNYIPNHNFGGPENRSLVIGHLRLSPDRDIYPGDEFEAEIHFLQRPSPEWNISIGRSWRIQEGPHLVAMGRILNIVAPRSAR